MGDCVIPGLGVTKGNFTWRIFHVPTLLLHRLHPGEAGPKMFGDVWGGREDLLRLSGYSQKRERRGRVQRLKIPWPTSTFCAADPAPRCARTYENSLLPILDGGFTQE